MISWTKGSEKGAWSSKRFIIMRERDGYLRIRRVLVDTVTSNATHVSTVAEAKMRAEEILAGEAA